jgi:hypothetical protein
VEIKQERIVEGPLMQVIKVDPDSRASTSGRPAPHLIHKRQIRVIEHSFVTDKIDPLALNWHLSLELVPL